MDPIRQQLDKILEAITDTRNALQQDIGAVSVGLGLLRTEHHKLEDRVKGTERKIEEIQPECTKLTTQMLELKDRVDLLEKHAEDSEGRIRGNVIRVVGLPEGIEAGNMVEYL